MTINLDDLERLAKAEDRAGPIAKTDEILELVAEVRRLRNLLACRPALNSGLIEAYSQWTAVVYDSEAARAKEKP
jgi:hypothetical protein